MFEKIASFIVNKRKAFLVFFILAAVFGVFSSSWVKVSDKLSDYLPESSETKQGLDIMDESFTTFGTAKVMIYNVDYDRALEVSKEIEDIKGVSKVEFYDKSDKDYENKDIEDYYKNFSALYKISFDDVESSKLVQDAIVKVRDTVSPYDNVVYTTIDKDDAKALNEDMKVIFVLVIIIIIVSDHNNCSIIVHLTNIYGNIDFHAYIRNSDSTEYRYKFYIRKNLICDKGCRCSIAVGACH